MDRRGEEVVVGFCGAGWGVVGGVGFVHDIIHIDQYAMLVLHHEWILEEVICLVVSGTLA